MIRQADMRDLDTLTDLTLELWPDHSRQEMKTELQRQLSVERAVYFLAVEEEKMAGFAQCQLRHDYVEGTESSPWAIWKGFLWRRKSANRELPKTFCRPVNIGPGNKDAQNLPAIVSWRIRKV